MTKRAPMRSRRCPNFFDNGLHIGNGYVSVNKLWDDCEGALKLRRNTGLRTQQNEMGIGQSQSRRMVTNSTVVIWQKSLRFEI